MFGLLNPFLLWLAPLLVAPLVIHFLGRNEPREREFPSLLAVRGQLSRAMRRHRLKNWLQLVLRTLVLLCLLLAAAGLVWRSPSLWTPPGSTTILIHNGAYGFIPTEGGTHLESQLLLSRGLDSLTPGRHQSVRILDTRENGGGAERFGKYGEAVARTLRLVESRHEAENAPHVYLPVFDTRDLAGLGDVLAPWLARYPEARVAMVDYTSSTQAPELLSPFKNFAADLNPDGTEGQVALRVSLQPGADAKNVVWIGGEGSRANPARATHAVEGDNDRVEIRLPLPETGGLTGRFVLQEEDPDASRKFAGHDFNVSLRVPPTATLCVVTTAANARAGTARSTLGQGGKRLKIVPILSSEDLQAANCDLLYLADPSYAESWQTERMLARAAAVLRKGGKVIVNVGPNTDIARWNRNLLEPLGTGKFTEVLKHGSWATRMNLRGLKEIGIQAESWGRAGAVRTHIGFEPGPNTRVLLHGKESPLLVYHRTGAAGGELLLWTTDLDGTGGSEGSPEWSDIGLGPWAALLHQSFLGRTWAADAEMRATDTDSTFFAPIGGPEISRNPETLRDAQGKPVSALVPEPAGVRAGPFDRTGLYRLETPTDTLVVAVNLAASRLEVSGAAEESWEEFYTSLGEPAAEQIQRVKNPKAWRELYGGFNLRFALLILAALLLFAEGLVSLRLSPFRN